MTTALAEPGEPSGRDQDISVSITCPVERQDQVADEVIDAISLLVDPSTIDFTIRQLDGRRIRVTATGRRP